MVALKKIGWRNPEIQKSIPPAYTAWRNRFLGSLNDYNFGLWSLDEIFWFKKNWQKLLKLSNTCAWIQARIKIHQRAWNPWIGMNLHNTDRHQGMSKYKNETITLPDPLSCRTRTCGCPRCRWWLCPPSQRHGRSSERPELGYLFVLHYPLLVNKPRDEGRGWVEKGWWQKVRVGLRGPTGGAPQACDNYRQTG